MGCFQGQIMHEASIIMSILDTVTHQCQKEGYHSISSISLQIGKASGILPDALLFAFDIAKAETIARDAELIIDKVPIGGICSKCNKEFDTDEAFIFECPYCGSDSVKITRGYEMNIIEMEVD